MNINVTKIVNTFLHILYNVIQRPFMLVKDPIKYNFEQIIVMSSFQKFIDHLKVLSV